MLTGVASGQLADRWRLAGVGAVGGAALWAALRAAEAGTLAEQPAVLLVAFLTSVFAAVLVMAGPVGLLRAAPRALGLVQAQAQAQAGAGLLGSMLGASAMQSVAQAYRDMNAALPQNVGLGMATLSPYAVPALMAQAMRMPTGYGYGYW